MDKKYSEYIINNWDKLPLSRLTNKLSLKPIEITSFLREKGIIEDAHPHEIIYILENHGKMPTGEIRKNLSMSDNQLYLILKKHGKTARVSRDNMDLKEAKAKTKWLIEEKLHFEIDDELPRNINNKHFTKNDLYDCIRFAQIEKEKDPLYKNFTVVAFLICQTYPQEFRPFQFKHSKTNKYFKGDNGKGNLINAIKWVIEKKLGYEPKLLSVIADSKYFLTTDELAYYGISAHYIKNHFSSHDKLISAILNEYDVAIKKSKLSTKELREILSQANRNTHSCQIPKCSFRGTPDIHHIVPFKSKNETKTDINCSKNLVVLCPNHHRIAEKFKWENNLNLENPDTWINSCLHFINKRDKPNTFSQVQND